MTPLMAEVATILLEIESLPPCYLSRKSGSATFSRKTAWRKGLDFQRNSRPFCYERCHFRGTCPRKRRIFALFLRLRPQELCAAFLCGRSLTGQRPGTIQFRASSRRCTVSVQEVLPLLGATGVARRRRGLRIPRLRRTAKAPSLLLSPRDPLALGSRGDPETAPNA